ncbi:MAG: NADH-quinone oxidoreductase subunit M [Deltaproteobacteria bacterium]|nr:NADH-quinone oxidoreductase subunit M [Deltaproteobacteria bacterium]
MLLIAILAIPLVGAIAVALMPRKDEQGARHMGMVFTLLTFFVSLALIAGFKISDPGMQFEFSVPWVRSLGINFHVGIDGISLWLVLLATLLGPIVMLSTYKAIDTRVKEFVASLLILEMAMIGALVSLDLFVFYVFWEIMLVPMYLMIGVWGHGAKIYAALKFVLYTLVGSLVMLVAIIYVYVSHGAATGFYTFDYMVLTQSVWGEQAQIFLFLAFAIAFAIKVPMFPLHTWLPDAHTQAPTAGSVILAGVLLKMGTYGFIRFAIPLFPYGAAVWAPYISGLAVIGIIYGALVAYAQKDAKKLVAYSSVSHLGFVMLGLMAMNEAGVTGSLYQMLNHGISTGGLFLAIGMLYERRHTHELDQFGGLWRRMPVFAGMFMIIMLSSAGLPGLNGFVGEFLILVGAFTHHQGVAGTDLPIFIWHSRLMAGIAAIGVVLGAVYLLHLYQKLMFGPITQPKNADLDDASWREILTFAPLIVLIFAMGIYPKPFLERMEPAVKLFLKEYKVKYKASEGYTGQQPKQLASLSRSKYALPALSAPRAGIVAKTTMAGGKAVSPKVPKIVRPKIVPPKVVRPKIVRPKVRPRGGAAPAPRTPRKRISPEDMRRIRRQMQQRGRPPGRGGRGGAG